MSLRDILEHKKVHLPEVLILDPEVARGSAEEGDAGLEGTPGSDEGHRGRRLRDEMLGDSEKGLSPEEVAKLSRYALSTVRAYLCDPQRRKTLGDAIRGDEQARAEALRIVVQRRPPQKD
jgi:hypothetical protein